MGKRIWIFIQLGAQESLAGGKMNGLGGLGIAPQPFPALDRTFQRQTREIIEKVEVDVEKAGDTIKAFEDTAQAINHLSHSVDKTVQSADRAIQQQSQNLDQLHILMTRTIEDLQDLIQEIKAKPWGLLYKEGKGRGE